MSIELEGNLIIVAICAVIGFAFWAINKDF
jgi:hypothetical protein